MLFYGAESISIFKGVKKAAEVGRNRLSKKKREKCKVETTKRDLEVVDGTEFKNVINEKVTPRSENFRRNTPIIAKIPAKDPITKNPVTSREFGHPCVEVFARVSFEGFKSDASGEWG